MRSTREQRLEELKLEFAARFEVVCSDMSREDFKALVDRMARFRLKYDELEAAPTRQLADAPQAEKPAQ